MTIYVAITRKLAVKAVKGSRVMLIVSRGGSMVAVWMMETGRENPCPTNWSKLQELFQEYDATISLGESLRPICIFDAYD